MKKKLKKIGTSKFNYTEGHLGDVLGTFQINLPGTSLDAISGRPQDVRLGRPRDGQIESLGDVLRTFEGTSWDVLGTNICRLGVCVCVCVCVCIYSLPP